MPMTGSGEECRRGQEPAHLSQHGDQGAAAVPHAAGTRSRVPRAVGAHTASTAGIYPTLHVHLRMCITL